MLGPGPTQPALGWGAMCYALAALMLIAYGLARQVLCKGDVFVVGALLLVVGLIALFVFYPVLCILPSAVRDNDGSFAPSPVRGKAVQPIDLGPRLRTRRRAAAASPGTPWRRQRWWALLTTLLGLAFALVAQRTQLPLKPLLRALSILPVITPPFVIGLALILLFGRAGMVTIWLGRRVRHSAQPLDLRHARHHHRAVAGVHPDCLPGAAGRAAGRQPEPGGSVADAARQSAGAHSARSPGR